MSPWFLYSHHSILSTHLAIPCAVSSLEIKVVGTQTAYAHITRTPGVCGGKPRIEGHRIRVQDIMVEHEWQALSPEEICHQHPGLTLAEIYSALAYLHDHRDVIIADLDADRRAVEDFREQHPNEVR